jgi:hypothetical protein
MVVTMLSSFRVEQLEGSWELLLRMGTLAVQDLTQVSLVIVSVVIGWYFVSLLLDSLNAFGAPQHKLHIKLDAQEPSPESSEESDVDSIEVERCLAVGSPGLTLLENYGIFGAAPGAWSRKALHLGHTSPVEDTKDDINTSTLAKEDTHPRKTLTLPVDDALGTETSYGQALLQQYGVFGVSPKHWGGSKVDKFGNFLSAIT